MPPENENLKKGAPDWWKADPEASWKQWMGLNDEYSRVCRVASNAEFQRDWIQKALTEIGIGLRVPHPEYPGDGDAKNAGLKRLVDSLGKITEDLDKHAPLSQEDREKLTTFLAIAIEGGIERFIADVVRQTWKDISTRLKTAAL